MKILIHKTILVTGANGQLGNEIKTSLQLYIPLIIFYLPQKKNCQLKIQKR